MTSNSLATEINFSLIEGRLQAIRTASYSRIWSLIRPDDNAELARGPLDKLLWTFNHGLPVRVVAQRARYTNPLSFLPTFSLIEGTIYIGDELGCSRDDALCSIEPLPLLERLADEEKMQLLAQMMLRYRLLVSAGKLQGLPAIAIAQLHKHGLQTPWSIQSNELRSKGAILITTAQLVPIMKLHLIDISDPMLTRAHNDKVQSEIHNSFLQRMTNITLCFASQELTDKLAGAHALPTLSERTS